MYTYHYVATVTRDGKATTVRGAITTNVAINAMADYTQAKRLILANHPGCTGPVDIKQLGTK